MPNKIGEWFKSHKVICSIAFVLLFLFLLLRVFISFDSQEGRRIILINTYPKARRSIALVLKIYSTKFENSYLFLKENIGSSGEKSKYTFTYSKSVFDLPNYNYIVDKDSDDLYYQDFRIFMDSIGKDDPIERNWNNWNWEDYYVFLKINVLNKATSSIDVEPNHKIKEELPKHLYILDCPEEKTFVVSTYNLELVRSNVDFWKEFDVDKDLFYTYCLEKTCEFVGRSCIIIKNVIK